MTTQPIVLGVASYSARRDAEHDFDSARLGGPEGRLDQVAAAVLEKGADGRLEIRRHGSTAERPAFPGALLSAAITVIAPPPAGRRVSGQDPLEFQGIVVGLRVWRLLPGGLALIVAMVLVLRPLTVALCTWRSRLGPAERAVMAWLAPLGIVAAATASAFGLQLAQKGMPGADDILPIAFIAIFGTVAIYRLTAAPVARRLGLAGAGAGLVLVVGGSAWAREIALALKAAGQRVRLWTRHADEQAAAREAGLETGSTRLGIDPVSREAALEEITEVLLMTDSDYFNALAAIELHQELGHDHVYRLPAREELLDLVPEHARGGILFGEGVTFAELTRRFEAGARLVTVPGAGGGVTPLFILHGDRLTVVTAEGGAEPGEGDTTIGLGARHECQEPWAGSSLRWPLAKLPAPGRGRRRSRGCRGRAPWSSGADPLRPDGRLTLVHSAQERSDLVLSVSAYRRAMRDIAGKVRARGLVRPRHRGRDAGAVGSTLDRRRGKVLARTLDSAHIRDNQLEGLRGSRDAHIAIYADAQLQALRVAMLAATRSPY